MDYHLMIPLMTSKKPPLYAKKNLLHAARFEFRARLVDGPNGERQYSRQKIGEPGLLIKTTLPADIYAWPALMVRCPYRWLSLLFICASVVHAATQLPYVLIITDTVFLITDTVFVYV